ncbi:hypothetical protein [Ornithinibacillus halotolerans]|uniref:Uncharacterized protein n=1 Tax=Ornithinibacillus halotolerans TaxID=1274357 RepID=A0A916W5L9_9BACI|nr:hypothetical protein [Ornithinibacillus halotolerans]GGA68333.1 hypothetical protein GCM10008025_10390 [Ornithinibacillus halotolerans]
MKKKSYFFQNEQGFTLPLVLMLTAITLLYVSTNLIKYHHDSKMTANLIEQITAQSLFELSYRKYKSEQYSQYNNGVEKINYTFPNGIVTIEISQSVDYIHLTFIIQTNGGYLYEVTKSLIMHPNEDFSSYTWRI